MFSVVFLYKNHPMDKSQVKIVLGRTVQSNEDDRSGFSEDQTSVLS